MFTPEKLEEIPAGLEKLFRQLENDIMFDIIRRMKLNANEITRAADWQIYRLSEIGRTKKSIKKHIQEVLELSNKEIDKIYNKAVKSGYSQDKWLYKAAGKPFIKFEDNHELQQLIRAIKKQTNEQLYNITQSAGFIKNVNGSNIFTPLTQYYQDILDNAIIGILTGAFDYNTIIKKTVQEMTKSGLRTIDENGRSYRIYSSSRTALVTGVNQVASKISDDSAKELDTEYFEVSAHGTARPSHQKWQGKVYTRKELEEICGLGKVDGLCGANCRHSYYPFIPGISERTYTDEELKKWAEEENTPKKYGDKEYTSYEATQEQRKFEATMRKQRQDIKLLKEGGANEEDLITTQAKYRITSDEYVKFSKAMELPQQKERVYGDGLRGEFGDSKSYKIIENRAKMYYNGNIETYLKDETIRKHIRDNANRTLLIDKQAEHIKDISKNSKYKEGKSYLNISNEEIQDIVNKYGGTGKPERTVTGSFANRERIVLDKVIGVSVNNKTGVETETRIIKIHYRKTGVHIVPTMEGSDKL